MFSTLTFGKSRQRVVSLKLSGFKLLTCTLLASAISGVVFSSVHGNKGHNSSTHRKARKRLWQEGDVRLFGGHGRPLGTVLIFHEGKWGTVCDDLWGVEEAQVVCRQLGLPGLVKPARQSEFGHRIGQQMWISQVLCNGTEERLDQCSFNGWGGRVRKSCPGLWRNAGVHCLSDDKGTNSAQNDDNAPHPVVSNNKPLQRIVRIKPQPMQMMHPAFKPSNSPLKQQRRQNNQPSDSASSYNPQTQTNDDRKVFKLFAILDRPRKMSTTAKSHFKSVIHSPSVTSSTVLKYRTTRVNKNGSKNFRTEKTTIPRKSNPKIVPMTTKAMVHVITKQEMLTSTKENTNEMREISSTTKETASTDDKHVISASTKEMISTMVMQEISASTPIPFIVTSDPEYSLITQTQSANSTFLSTTPKSTRESTMINVTDHLLKAVPMEMTSSATKMTPSNTAALESFTVQFTSNMEETYISSSNQKVSSTTITNIPASGNTLATSPIISTTPENLTSSTTWDTARSTESWSNIFRTDTSLHPETTSNTEDIAKMLPISSTLPLASMSTTESRQIIHSTPATASDSRSFNSEANQVTSTHLATQNSVISENTILTNNSTLPVSIITSTTTKKTPSPKLDVDFSKVKATADLQLQNKKLVRDDVLLQADAPNRADFEIKIVGGRYSWEGRLETRELNAGPDAWGTICGADWSIRETMVVCRQLNMNFAKQALQTNYFGGHDTKKIFYGFKCSGREEKLSDCEAIKISEKFQCPKPTLVAGIVCSTYLPDLIPDARALEDSIRLQDRPLYYLQCALEENCLSSSAYVIRNNSRTWHSSMRRLLRFSTVVHNRGTADFRPYQAKAQWQWHACHMHYHSMEIFAHYDILDANNTRLAEGSKASFCLEDTTCDRGVHPVFNCNGFGDQGLSVNCSDNYLWDIDCQWIDITDIPPGEYTFLLEVNPSFYVAELNFDNNVVRCNLWYSGYNARFSQCRLESLLDYRIR